MQLTKAIEQIASRAKNTGLRAALSELVRELGSGLSQSLLRSIAESKSSLSAAGKVSSEPAHAKYVFNVAVSVAVGVPVNTTDAEPGPAKQGQPKSASIHGEGAPAVATATVHALPGASEPSAHALTDASEPSASPAFTPRREARKTVRKSAAKKSPRRRA